MPFIVNYTLIKLIIRLYLPCIDLYLDTILLRSHDSSTHTSMLNLDPLLKKLDDHFLNQFCLQLKFLEYLFMYFFQLTPSMMKHSQMCTWPWYHMRWSHHLLFYKSHTSLFWISLILQYPIFWCCNLYHPLLWISFMRSLSLM